MNTLLRSFFVWTLVIVFACPASESDAQTVYVTKTGAKYHRENCQYLRYSKFAKKLSEAKKFYTACLVCKPPVDVTEEDEKEETEAASSSAGENAPVKTDPPAPREKKVTSSQCSALTKAGSRCKRMTSESNGKCWQHQ